MGVFSPVSSKDTFLDPVLTSNVSVFLTVIQNLLNKSSNNAVRSLDGGIIICMQVASFHVRCRLYLRYDKLHELVTAWQKAIVGRRVSLTYLYDMVTACENIPKLSLSRYWC